MKLRGFKSHLIAVTLFGFVLHPIAAWSGGAGGHRSVGGGGFRGGSPPAHVSGPPHAAPSAAPHVPSAAPHSVGIHGGAAPMHGAFPPGHPGFGPGGIHDAHYAGMLHSTGPHWNGYHQAFIGNHAVRLAGPGYRPSYYYHPWYHGPWHGYGWGWGWGFGPGVVFGLGGAGWGLSIGSGYGPYGYWGYPLGWGYGGWGLGRTVYVSGYYPYYNPYFSPVVYPTIVYDYSRPIPVATQGASVAAADTTPVDPAFENARRAFAAGDYLNALSGVDSAISRNPSDAVFHEFRALVLFARRDYRQAAATLHSLLAVGPGWDWTTMSSLYSDPAVYTGQLRALESYTVANPQAADARFLLGYHYMIGGHKAAAAAQLQEVVTLMPNDRLAGELLRMVQGPPDKSGNADFGIAPSPNPPVDTPPAANPIDTSLLAGDWQAKRGDGSEFRLTLTEQGTFRWKFTNPNQKGDEFGGKFTTDGPVLILERAEGGALAGTATFADDRHFVFKLVGAPPDDQGLSFTR